MIGAAHFSPPQNHSYILWNVEQTQSEHHFNHRLHLAANNALMVWDFSPVTVEEWGGVGVAAVYMPFASLELKPPSHDDSTGRALFIGARCDRRILVDQKLAGRGLPIDMILDYETWGEERTHRVDAAAVVVNLHCFPGAALETERITQALARSKAVVSETSTDKKLDQLFSDCIVFVPPVEEDEEGWVKAVVELLGNHARRRQLEANALPCLRKIVPSQLDVLRSLV
mmetsp:Transcript_33691/g.72682  ORF Transcript_33691/g.72682 Transcript_33691/m.72682 type:complete len:228 (+) Transcript_33691:3-686(+)